MKGTSAVNRIIARAKETSSDSADYTHPRFLQAVATRLIATT